MPILRPAICKKPHGSCWPEWPPARPLFCHASLALWDLDPLDPVGAAGYTTMPMVDPAPIYEGSSPTADNVVGCRLEPEAAPNRWKVTATLWPPAHAPEQWIWPDIWIDPLLPLDTRLLHNVIWPGVDWQKVRVMA